MVPCQAGVDDETTSSSSPPPSTLAISGSLSGSCRSTAVAKSAGRAAGRFVCNTVHGLLTSGRISGCLSRSSCVGCHVRPSGGPNNATDLSSRAHFRRGEFHIRRMVCGQRRRRRRRQLAKVGVHRAPCSGRQSFSHVMSRSDGRKTGTDGRPSTLATASSRTSRSFVLLQPQ